MSRKNDLRKKINFYSTIFLVIAVIILIALNIARFMPFKIKAPTNIVFDKETNTINFESMTLRQKIAQMIIAYEKRDNLEELNNMLIGGIYLSAKPTRDEFTKTIKEFQGKSIVPLFIAVDMEGCINPFENFKKFPSLPEIKTNEDAYEVGYEEGKMLNELGFSINFAPVVDLKDSIWKCRSFNGTPEEVAEKSSYYIKGMQENHILATAKHYPGKTLSVNDPHKNLVYATIENDDLIPFENAIRNNVSAIMISHVIASGAVDSESMPAVVSMRLSEKLRNEFDGLIISDDTGMPGLKDYYKNKDEMYIDLFKAENDMILYFDKNPRKLYHLLSVIENAVKNGEISEARIDNSVLKILRYKGINAANP